MIDVYKKKVNIYAPVDLNDRLYEQEISLQQPYRNFASKKKDSLNVAILCDIPN